MVRADCPEAGGGRVFEGCGKKDKGQPFYLTCPRGCLTCHTFMTGGSFTTCGKEPSGVGLLCSCRNWVLQVVSPVIVF